jgi:hypothetical protein
MEVTPVKESSSTEQNHVENRPVETATSQNHAKPPDQLEKVVTSPTISIAETQKTAQKPVMEKLIVLDEVTK